MMTTITTMTTMSESRPQDHGETPTVELRVHRHGRLLVRELCESEDDAALAVDAWAELEGVECEVDDLSVRHRPAEILAPEPPEPDTEEYLRTVESAASSGRRT